MNGHKVRNTIGGDYFILNGNNIKTSGFRTTAVGEPYWGCKFGDLIDEATSFERTQDRLFIKCKEGKALIDFGRVR